MSTPWMKFYPRDWRGDQALRMVSLAARGLWIECLAVMHEASPYGHLVINGRPVGDDALARMVGASGDEVRTLMSELREAGVFEVTGAGVIFSRRMVRDQERAAKGRKAVKKRWSQAAEKKAETKGSNRSPNSPPITQKPEARGQKEGSREREQIPAIRDQFERFWEAYPDGQNKGGKKTAFGHFRILVVDEGEDPEALIAAAARYAGTKPDPKFSWAAWKFLHDEHWRNFPGRAAPQAPDSPQQWASFVGYYARHGEWCGPGPRPGEPGCQAPAEIQREHGFTPKPGIAGRGAA